MFKYTTLTIIALASAIFSISPASAAVPDSLSGLIKVDGSSTVYPITEAVAEEFGNKYRSVRVTVGISGTGGGFKKFTVGEIDISDASRPIKSAESEAAKSNKVEFIELPVAYDALTVVVNKKNTWLTSITVAELAKLWAPEAQGKIVTWKQVNSAWPDLPIKLYGPGTDSGTFDYFTEAIVGTEGASRGDFTSSEDDNVLVQGVSADVNAMGFFGVAYYEENIDKLRAVPVDDGKVENGNGPQLPTLQNVVSGNYQPLSRPLFVYVNKKSLTRPEVNEFVKFYMANVASLAREVGYVPLNEQVYKLAQRRLQDGIVGSIFGSGGSQVGVTLEKLLGQEKAEAKS